MAKSQNPELQRQHNVAQSIKESYQSQSEEFPSFQPSPKLMNRGRGQRSELYYDFGSAVSILFIS